MLVAADETLFHQIARPFAQTAISDHRFYDRHWFTGLDPAGGFGFNLGMGLYKNTNVLDGYFAVQRNDRQHNLRLSRVLRPELERCAVGPLSIEIVEPFKHIRINLGENEHGIGCLLDWRSDYAVHLEAMHADQVLGMITQEVSRYDQVASVSGWIMVDGEKHKVEDWWSVRDHSWGVRPGVGGFEPVRGDHSLAKPPQMRDQLRLWLWSCFSTSEYSMQMQRVEDSAGRVMHLDGELLFKPSSGRLSLRVKEFDHDIGFHPGTHAVEHLRYAITLSDGSKIDIEGEPAIRAWAYKGTGYDLGYNDGRGLGAQRGNVMEYDVYDMSHVEQVRNAAGELTGPGHREQPVKLKVNGEPCLGHFPVMVFDTLPGMSD